jgi:Zn-dependent alcohol dehydrogenase
MAVRGAGNHMTIEIRQLRYAVITAEKQSFARAARALNVRQSTLSRRIGALESRRGIKLLERNSRGAHTSIIVGVAEAGKEIATRPFQLVTGRNWRGTAFGGAKGRTDAPKIVDMYMTGKIEIDPMITHVMGDDDINAAFDLMHAGESICSVVVF